MASIHDHVVQQAARFEELAIHPVVAWDALSADKWAKQLEMLAEQIAGMSDDEALAHLKTLRDGLWTNPRSSWSLMNSMDAIRKMNELIDPVAKDKVGWIEVAAFGGLDNGQRSIRPGYRRMLGVNNVTSGCARALDEPEDAWLARRDIWLAQYHPDIKVIRGRTSWGEGRSQYTTIIGTVSEFRSMRHVVERDLAEGMQFLVKNGFAHSICVEHAGPLNRDDGAEYLAKTLAQGEEVPLTVGTLIDTEYGRCAIVA